MENKQMNDNRLQAFRNWLIDRERTQRIEFDKKGWHGTKLEITVIREKFDEIFEKEGSK